MRCGVVALLGRPNSGKSTLLNALTGQKIAIVSDKPQTTRHTIRGIVSRPEGQIVFVDTPGIHRPGYRLNRMMMHGVRQAAEVADLLALIIDATSRRGRGDAFALDLVRELDKETVLLLNKIDLVQNKSRLLEIIKYFADQQNFGEIIPISARTEDGTGRLIESIFDHLPEGAPLFPGSQVTDQSERHLAGEFVREKILELTSQELPFATAVLVERYVDEEKIVRICATILVEKPSQRGIVIGRLGQKLKEIGTRARRDIEAMLGKKIFLELYARVKPNWRNDEQVLETLLAEAEPVTEAEAE